MRRVVPEKGDEHSVAVMLALGGARRLEVMRFVPVEGALFRQPCGQGAGHAYDGWRMNQMRDTTIRLPWPDRALFSNGSHGHWAPKARAKKAARTKAYWIAEAAGAVAPSDGAIFLRVDFYPPDKRPRDRTNMESACKAYFDGIADAMGVNDVRFQPIYFVGEPVKGGAVHVRVLTDDAWRSFGELAARVVGDVADRLEIKEAAE